MGLWLGLAVISPAENVTFKAQLIQATNDAAPLDRRLEKIEYRLRPILRYENYRLLGESSAVLALPGDTVLRFDTGSSLAVRASGSLKKGVKAEVVWTEGGQKQVTTTVRMARGKPVVIGGGAASEKGVLVISLQVE